MQAETEYDIVFRSITMNGGVNLRVTADTELTANTLAEWNTDTTTEYMTYTPTTSGMYVLLVEANSPGIDAADYSLYYGRKHPSFTIESDDDLIHQALLKNWPGTGSKTHPILISGYSFVQPAVYQTSLILFRIASMNLYFEIANNIFIGDAIGIYLENVSHGKFFKNVILQVGPDIVAINSPHNVFEQNLLFAHGTDAESGIRLINCSNSRIIDNKVGYSNFGGINLEDSDNSIISGNTIEDARFGFDLFRSNNCVITDNIVSKSETGIDISGHNNLVINNTIHSNSSASYSSGVSIRGSFLGGSSNNNTIINNTIHSHQGIAIAMRITTTPTKKRSVTSTQVKWNKIITYDLEAGSQALDNGDNNIFKYNYWNDWANQPDTDGDGIIDTFYPIGGSAENFDPFPLIASDHQLSYPTLIFPNATTKTLDGSVMIQWSEAVDFFAHPVTYAVYVSPNSGNIWTLLIEDSVMTNYTWDTTTLEDTPNYMIKVVAICSRGHRTSKISYVFTITNSASATPAFSFVEIVFPLFLVTSAAIFLRKRKIS
ncbi:MAG: right-handed parallel beta-helix repeat-containing protein [Candidatus Hodarchaeota archaeon]